MIREWLSGQSIIPAAIAFFLFATVFLGMLVYLKKAGKKHFKHHEELPFHDGK